MVVCVPPPECSKKTAAQNIALRDYLSFQDQHVKSKVFQEMQENGIV